MTGPDDETVAAGQSAPSAEPAPGDRLGGYRLLERVGAGGMGAVFRAEDVELSRDVAVKVIVAELADDPEFRRRFQREARLAARIDHPNVLPVYRTGEDAGRLFLAMRWLDGTDARAEVRRRGRLPPREAVAIVAQVADALDAAHAAGLVHRDVKPGNVLLRSDGHAYLADFGLSIEPDGEETLTAPGRRLGTPAYLAPEQIRGGDVDARTDVYALGGVLHHLLTGQVPFPGRDELGTIGAHLAEPPPRPSALVPGLPRAFDAVVARAMAKSPGERYRSAGELARAAHAAVVGGRARLRRRARPRRAPLLALAALAAGGAVVLALSVDPAPPRRAPSAAAPIAVPGPPDRLAVAGGRVWVLPRLGAALIAVDPRSHRVREYQVPAFFGAGGPFPGLAAGPLGLWVANADPRNGGVDRVDLATGRSRAHARVPRAQAVAVGSDAVWVAHQTAAGRGELVRVSDAGERSPSRVSAGREPVALALAFGSLWVADRAANAVLRIDPVQRRLLARVPVGRGPAALAPAGGRVWVANLGARTLTAIDPATNEVVGAPVRLGKEIEDVAGLRDTLWVAAADSTVTRLEARTGAVIRSLDTLPAPLALAADARGGVWVGSAREQRVTRIDAS